MAREENPFARLHMYSDPTNDGGISIDLATLAEDFIATAKLCEIPLDEVVKVITSQWEQVPGFARMPNKDDTKH